MSKRAALHIYWAIIGAIFVTMLAVRGNSPGTYADLMATFAIIGGHLAIVRYWPSRAHQRRSA